jgi:hypothetical protein
LPPADWKTASIGAEPGGGLLPENAEKPGKHRKSPKLGEKVAAA